jgi:hypothetical protein
LHESKPGQAHDSASDDYRTRQRDHKVLLSLFAFRLAPWK